jgi:hypothetical protein
MIFPDMKQKCNTNTLKTTFEATDVYSKHTVNPRPTREILLSVQERVKCHVKINKQHNRKHPIIDLRAYLCLLIVD